MTILDCGSHDFYRLLESSGVLVVRLRNLSTNVYCERRHFHTFSVVLWLEGGEIRLSSLILHAILPWLRTSSRPYDNITTGGGGKTKDEIEQEISDSSEWTGSMQDALTNPNNKLIVHQLRYYYDELQYFMNAISFQKSIHFGGNDVSLSTLKTTDTLPTPSEPAINVTYDPDGTMIITVAGNNGRIVKAHTLTIIPLGKDLKASPIWRHNKSEPYRQQLCVDA